MSERNQQPLHEFQKQFEYKILFGNSFRSSSCAFHTLRYDFKPASIDTERPASLLAENGQVTVDFTSQNGSDILTFQGPMKPCSKECILIYNPRKRTFTLEKLSLSTQLKKIRSAKTSLASSANPNSNVSMNPRSVSRGTPSPNTFHTSHLHPSSNLTSSSSPRKSPPLKNSSPSKHRPSEENIEQNQSLLSSPSHLDDFDAEIERSFMESMKKETGNRLSKSPQIQITSPLKNSSSTPNQNSAGLKQKPRSNSISSISSSSSSSSNSSSASSSSDDGLPSKSVTPLSSLITAANPNNPKPLSLAVDGQSPAAGVWQLQNDLELSSESDTDE